MENFDCVVVGAGWYGLAAARQFHYTQPDSSLVIFDSQSSLGGTWAKERLYSGLKSNNILGTYEYPGFPMTSDKFDVKPGEHIKGTTLHTYLNAYAKHNGIADLVCLNHTVLTAEHHDTDDGGWILTVATPSQGERRIFARRLILATGLTSNAYLPQFDGQEDFGGRIFHGKHFQQNSDTLETAKAVTIFGATKFGWDAAYAYATAGIKVNWVVRSSGHGPCWITKPYATPLKLRTEKLANTRLVTWFSPCIWDDADGYGRIRRFFHGTSAGRKIVDLFWKVFTHDIMGQNDYDAHPDTAKLKPWTEAMFVGDSISVLNYDRDIFSLIRSDLITVHVDEIDHLSPGTVHLASGTSFASDVLLANTGWKHVPNIKFLPEGIAAEMGIPHTPTTNTNTNTTIPPNNTTTRVPTSGQDLANQHTLIEAADREILRRFPRLKRQPVWNAGYKPLTSQKGIRVAEVDDGKGEEVTPYTPLTPFMLYRFLVPASPRFMRTRDVAFAGMMSNTNNAVTAHVGGLWISAFFAGGKLGSSSPSTYKSKSKSKAFTPTASAVSKADSGIAISSSSQQPPEGDGDERLQYETVLYNRWGKWRYPTDWGTKRPSFVFDAVPYFDLLQTDLGLDPHRKRGWFAEITQPYGPDDYRSIEDEWMRKQRDRGQ